MLPQAADSRARPRIGRYLITGRIGRGGMGMVYRGLDEALEREVAVKTLHAEGSLDADSRRRFEVEARTVGVVEGREGWGGGVEQMEWSSISPPRGRVCARAGVAP